MILIGLLLPTLSGVRQSARATQLASQMRHMAMLIGLYCNDQDDVYPVADDRFWFVPSTGPAETPPYQEGRWWGYPLIDLGYFTVEQAKDPDAVHATNQQLSIAMCYDPGKMRPDSIELHEQRFTTGIRQSAASFPSSKGLLWPVVVEETPQTRYWCCTRIDPPGPVAFADGSVELIAWHALPSPSPAPVLGIGHVVSSTWNGIYGRDR